MAAILERVRGGAVAAGRAAVRFHIVEAVVTAAGGALGEKLDEYLKTNKTMVKLYQSTKEWGDFIIGFAVPVIYELVKERFKNVPYLDQLVYGMSAVLMSKTLTVVMGKPFAIVLDNGELYFKNLSPKDNNLMVMVDGEPNVYNTSNKTWANDISEGVHDIVVIGEKKAVYFRQYTPSVTGAGAGGGTVSARTVTTIAK